MRSLLFILACIYAANCSREVLLVAAEEETADTAAPRNEPHDQAQTLLRNFFDSIFDLQHFGEDLVTIKDASSQYPALAKSSFSCPFTYDRVPQTQTQCFTPIITIYDRISNSLEKFHEPPIPLPEVLFLSGLDAPDEMDLAGPSSIFATLHLLLDCAQCESLSPWISHNATDEAIVCRERLRARGIDDSSRKWIARLVVTRRIVAVPIADVAGFYHQLANELSNGIEDTEQFVNAACDFPHSMNGTDGASSSCMSTYPARIVNELFLSHAFQLGLTFHGSKSNSVGRIEIPSNLKSTLDEEAMREIALALSSVIDLEDAIQYEVSTRNVTNDSKNGCTGDVMENWAFAGGLSDLGYKIGGHMRIEQCACGAFADGVCDYQSERTGTYPDSSLRSLIAKVVSPRNLALVDILCLPGFDLNVRECYHGLERNDTIGAVSHAITRMVLAVIDLVQPYTSVISIAGVNLRDDIVPMSPRIGESCTQTKVMRLPESSSNNNITVTWSVGGALNVDETAVMYGEWSKLDKKIFNCAAQPTKSELDAFFEVLRDFEELEGETPEEMKTELSFTPVQSGVTKWHSSQSNDVTFSVTLDLSRYKKGDAIAIYALGRVDQWTNGHSEEEINPPLSNYVNARTNPEWIIYHPEFDSADRESSIKSRLDFFSVPVTIEISDRPGFFERSSDITEASVRLSDAAVIREEQSNGVIYAICMAILTITLVFICTWCREDSDGTDVCSVLTARKKIMHQRISVDDFLRTETVATHDLELT